MAFCPDCGKAVAEQAVKCLACGKELGGPKGAARFKGTMMMQAPAPAPAGTAAPSAPEPAAVPKPAAKPLKGTMIGGMAAPAPPTAPAADAAHAPTPAAAAPKQASDAANAADDGDGGDGRFLVGDPMAPPEATPAAMPPDQAPRPLRHRSPPAAEPSPTGRAVLIALTGMAVMAAIAALVARQLGLF